MLTVTTPAQDRTLLTLPELRGAVSQSGTATDADLQEIGDRIAGVVASYCKIPTDGVNPPTLRKERIVETFRLDRPRTRLILARHPVAAVVDAMENGIAVTAADYELHPGGLLARLRSDRLAFWGCGKIVVTYEAGFERVPDDLKMAAIKLARLYWSERSRDPLVKSEAVPDVLTTSYWVGSIGDGSLPPEIADLLSPYVHRMVA
jgi:hypothetical protein